MFEMERLQSIKQELETNQSLSVSERGTGKATFLYVRSATRSVEVYNDGDSFVVECWNTADEKSDDPPVSQETVRSVAAAVVKKKCWLVC